MKLYFLPGSCALAPHIALELAGARYEAVGVVRGEQDAPEYRAVNPLGRVPALVVDDGTVLTEVPAILTYIADRFPAATLLPPPDELARYEALASMAYLSSTVHPAFGRLWRAERFTTDTAGRAAIEAAAARDLAAAFEHIEAELERRPIEQDGRPSAVDCYRFVFGRWGRRLPTPTSRFPAFAALTERMGRHEAVRKALDAQGVTLEGPASGPG